MRRTLAAFLIGTAIGAALTIGYLDISGRWFTYRTLSASDCRYPEEIIGVSYHVVPHQPNPCHFRRPRWNLWP